MTCRLGAAILLVLLASCQGAPPRPVAPRPLPARGQDDEALDRLRAEEELAPFRRALSGYRLAYGSIESGNWEVFLLRGDGTEPRNLTCNNAMDIFVGWSDDGLHILIRSDRTGELETLVVDLSGRVVGRPADDPRYAPRDDSPTRSVSANGSTLVFCREDRNGRGRIFAKDTTAGAEWPITPEGADYRNPDVTPDGEWAAALHVDASPAGRTAIEVLSLKEEFRQTVASSAADFLRPPRWQPAPLSTPNTWDPSLFPLEVGNRWIYDHTDETSSRPFEIRVVGTARTGDDDYFVLDNLWGDLPGYARQHLVRFDAERGAFVERRQGEDIPVFHLLPPEPVPFVEIVEVPAGRFPGCFRTAATAAPPPTSIRGGSRHTDTFAPGVGLVRRVLLTWAGEVRYELIGCRIGEYRAGRFPKETSR